MMLPGRPGDDGTVDDLHKLKHRALEGLTWYRLTPLITGISEGTRVLVAPSLHHFTTTRQGLSLVEIYQERHTHLLQSKCVFLLTQNVKTTQRKTT